jgi:prepilin-type N-terminal cleavage/methylation domain-containing protein
MTSKRIKSTGGFTLVEVMITILILSVAVIGASGYRYYSALDARKADLRVTAARVGLLLCESWRGVEGVETYDPVAHFQSDLAIAGGSGPAAPEGFTLLGSYEITVNGITYYASLSWKDMGTGLRALNVVVAWPLANPGALSLADMDKLFQLTTYTYKYSPN